MEFLIVTGLSGAGKSRAVDALEDIANRRAALVEDNGVGVVDVSGAPRFSVAKLAVNQELARDGAQVV